MYANTFKSLTLLLLTLMMASQQANASLLVFEDEKSYLDYLGNQPVEQDNFKSIAPGYYGNPISRMADSTSAYSISSTGYVGLEVQDSTISTLLPKTGFRLEGDSSLLRAIGGFISMSDTDGNLIEGTLKLRLQDGDIQFIDLKATPSFIGIISTDSPLSFIELMASTNPPLLQLYSLSLSSLSIPAAPSLALLLAGPLLSRPRRRRISPTDQH